MLEFKIDGRVAFRPPGEAAVAGMLTRYNRNTVTVITDEGRQWNVSPGALSRVIPTDATKAGGPNRVRLGKR